MNDFRKKISLTDLSDILKHRFVKSQTEKRQAFESSLLHLAAQAQTLAEEILPFATTILLKQLEPLPDAATARWLGKFDRFLVSRKKNTLGFRPCGTYKNVYLSMTAGSDPERYHVYVDVHDDAEIGIEVYNHGDYYTFEVPKNSVVPELIQAESLRRDPIWYFDGVVECIDLFCKQIPEFCERFQNYVESVVELVGDNES